MSRSLVLVQVAEFESGTVKRKLVTPPLVSKKAFKFQESVLKHV